MAIDKKFTTNNGLQTPNIEFSSPDGTKKIQASMLDSDTLSISGESGQLFSISDSMSGTIFAVNDISGVPSIEVDDDGTIRLAESFGNVLIGKTTNDGAKLQIAGNITVSGTVDGRDISVDGAKLDGIAPGAQVNTVTSVATRTGAVVLTKSDVGLANVDNTTDLLKPISTATQTALDGKPSLTGTGASGTWPISISGLSGSSSSMVVKDTRAVNGAPESYTGISSDLKTNTTDGLSDGGTYHGVITIRQYSSDTDWSGGGVRQLGFTDNHNLWIRGANASTTWSSWARFYKTTDASSTNTNNALVLRDASGNFSAGSITASLNGNASTATKLATARTINGVSFDGSANITVADSTKLPTAGGTMTGAITFAAGQTWPTFNQSTTGNAATATKLATARTINGVPFDGTANVTITAQPAFAQQHSDNTSDGVPFVAGVEYSLRVNGTYSRSTPASPAIGDKFILNNLYNTWESGLFTLTRGSSAHKINNIQEDVVFDANARRVELTYIYANEWIMAIS